MPYPATAVARDFLRQIEQQLSRLDVPSRDLARVLQVLALLASERASKIRTGQ